jgi:hypothetical protein
MVESISYDFVWRMYQKEKQTNQLLQISKAFYSDIYDYLKTNALTEQQKTNMEAIILAMVEKRKQKIFLYAAYGKPLPQPISDTEQEFYNKLIELTATYKINKADDANKRTKLVKSLTDVPEIILPSGSKFGPLKKNEIAELQNRENDIAYLLKNTLCEIYNG